MISDDELKEKVFSLLLTKEYEEKTSAQKKSKTKPPNSHDIDYKNLKEVKSSYLTQYLIDNGLGIHEKDLNKILMQTLKEQAFSSVSSQANKADTHQELERENISHISRVESKNKLLLAESRLLQPQEKLKSGKVQIEQDESKKRLDETSRRLLKNLEHYVETSTLITAQKTKELMMLTDMRQEQFNIIDYRTKGDAFRLKDIIPNQYNIIDVNTIKTIKR